MLGFIIGTVCLIGLIKVVRGRRHGWARMHGYGYGGGCGYGGGHGYGRGWGGPGDGWGGPGWGRHHDHGGHDHGPGSFGGGGFFLRGLFQRLDTTPGQEKVIRSAFEQVQKTMQEARGEWRDGSEVADLFRGETFDRTAAEGVSGKADASFAKVRVAIVEALAQIHEVLDERQRGMIADFLARGPMGRSFFRGVRGERSAWV
jgi:Spy/CpxP family protein refolding chaperone